MSTPDAAGQRGGGAPLLGEPLPIELVNTAYAAQGRPRDGLVEPTHLAEWLAAHRADLAVPLGDVELSAVDEQRLDRFRALRSSVRNLIIATVEHRVPASSDVAAVNRLSRAGIRWPQLVWPPEGTPDMVLSGNGDPVLGALGEVAQRTIELVAGPDRDLIQPCLAPGCVLFFLRSHPRREWCSRGCGNRVRVARHYRRWHRAADSVDSGTP